jgi:hypothetical protein
MTTIEDKKTSTITFTPDRRSYLAFFGVLTLGFGLALVEAIINQPQAVVGTAVAIVVIILAGFVVMKFTYVRIDRDTVETRIIYVARNVFPLAQIARLEVDTELTFFVETVGHKRKQYGFPVAWFEDNYVIVDIIQELQKRNSNIVLDESVRAYMKKLAEKKSKSTSTPNKPQGT